jgi:hypothetical protein
MDYRSSIGIIARTIVRTTLLMSALCLTSVGALAFDQTRYPDWAGQWVRFPGHPGNFDPSKPRRAQQVPLTPEYQAIYEANLRDQDEGKQGIDPTYTCLSPGMPRIMNIYEPMEIVITPDTTHILTQHIHDARRIFTDGRDWPADENPTFAGYSIGKWLDEDGDGRYDVLEVETRNLKGPRTYDASGIPFHADGQTVIKERIYRDKTDPNVLYDEITSIDHALTRPWTVLKKYSRSRDPRPVWRESVCADDNNHVEIAKEGYMRSAEGLLMPTRRNQPPPDLKYFNRPAK